MTDIPLDLLYTDSHEWIRNCGDGTAIIGITDHAQGLLGDLVYVELPEVGQDIEQGEEAGVVESVKAASDVYAPLSGEITEVNTTLENAPERVNQSPYDDGWLYQIKFSDEHELNDLMDNERYADCIEE